ncbi:hypothetical protein [Rothia mucilaginosa]|uniref:hypothetical protein n=1 Tax=Rothia mucilaginosa TaxID=43675 RepID=UPI00066A2D9E|nr:hypothetical protein [Rothia mucilaginosa]
MTAYIKVSADFKTMLESESAVAGTVEFTPTTVVTDAGTVFAPAKITGHLVGGGILADSPYAKTDNAGVKLVALPGGVRYTATAYLRAADGTGIPAITWALTAITGQDINLADAPVIGDKTQATVQPSPPSARRTAFRVVEAGDGLGRLIEVEEN